VRNLLHAAAGDCNERRTFMLPALHVTVGALVAAVGRYSGNAQVRELVSWQPDPWVQFNFGSYPPLQVPLAEAAGFHADASLEKLVADALE
jgi:hypothetical protein